jgi:hypothetical protein
MELTVEQLEAIKAASREIEFGKVPVSFSGTHPNAVDIIAERHIRYRCQKTAEPTTGEAVDRRGSGRY